MKYPLFTKPLTNKIKNMIINGKPGIYKLQGTMQTTREQMKSLQVQYANGQITPNESQFLCGYPWFQPMSDPDPKNDGSRLVALGILNSYAAANCITETSSNLKLHIKKIPKWFKWQHPIYFNEKNTPSTDFNSWEEMNVEYEYQQGTITHPFNFKKGRFSLTCKMPEGEWLWPSFWLARANSGDYFEIDIFEALSHKPLATPCDNETNYCHKAYINIHMTEYCKDVPTRVQHDYDVYNRELKVTGSMVTSQITYECLWTDEGILFSYDGVLQYIAVFTDAPRYDELKKESAVVNVILGPGVEGNNIDFWTPQKRFYNRYWKDRANFIGKKDLALGENEIMEITNFTYEEWGVDIVTYPNGSTNIKDFIESINPEDPDTPIIVPYP